MQLLGKPWRRRPQQVSRILIAHHLLLGDTLMLTPLLAALRQCYPQAEILMLCPKAIAPLYQGRPYDVSVLPWHPADAKSLLPLWQAPGFDLAFVPGDNRYSWLALAALDSLQPRGPIWVCGHSLGSALSSRASSHTMVQAIEPSSICVRRRPAACWIKRPTSVLPVKAKKRTKKRRGTNDVSTRRV